MSDDTNHFAPDDFPAAHSMDTDWFAVDADGRVGFFDSGEGGAVPEQIVERWGSYADPWDLVEPPNDGARTPRTFPIDVAEIPPMETVNKLFEEFEWNIAHAHDYDRDVRTLTLDDLALFTTSAEVSRELARHATKSIAVDDESGDLHVLLTQSIALHAVYEALRMGDILGGAQLDYEILPRVFGLFVFEHMAYDHTIPYRRVHAPRVPVLMENLGKEAKTKAGEMRFGDVDFEEATQVDPLRYGPCNHW